MKTLLKSIRITFAFVLVLGVCYVAVLWAFAQMFGRGKNGNAELVMQNGEVVGAANVGQKFTSDRYFWGRPSAVDYTADASGASNKGATNEQYLNEVETRIEAFLEHHPYLTREEIPAAMVTASGSGLDPHLTPECVAVQVERVARAREMSSDEVLKLVEQHTERPFLGIFGPAKINVLKLNVALDEAAH